MFMYVDRRKGRNRGAGRVGGHPVYDRQRDRYVNYIKIEWGICIIFMFS